MSHKNEEVLLEVNPRPSGSLAAALEAGFPIFDATIAKIFSRKISRALNLDSLHDIDLMSHKNEEVLLEVNPRPSGSLAAALEAGFPIFDATIAKIFDRKIPVPKINKNISISPKKNYLLKIDR